MHAVEGVDEIRYQRGKSRIERWPAGDQYVVIVGARPIGHNVAYRGLEATLDAIALHRPSDLPADGEAEPGPGRLAAAPLRLQNERARRAARAAANAQELRPPPECRKSASRLPVGCGPVGYHVLPRLPPRRTSRREPLAALGPPTRQNASAARGLHALAKAVAALANEPARLIGALHVPSPYPPDLEPPRGRPLATANSQLLRRG